MATLRRQIGEDHGLYQQPTPNVNAPRAYVTDHACFGHRLPGKTTAVSYDINP